MRLTFFALASGLAAALLGGPLAGIGAASASATPAPAVTGTTDPRPGTAEQVRACRSSDYKPIYEGREPAAGTVYIKFSMARIQGDGPGEEPCLQHTPVAMHWIDTLGGQRVGDWADYDNDPPEPFVVPPGGVADLTIRQPDPRNYPEDECRPKPVAGVQIYLEFEGDKGVYGSTGGQDVMCSRPGKAVPTVSIEPHRS